MPTTTLFINKHIAYSPCGHFCHHTCPELLNRCCNLLNTMEALAYSVSGMFSLKQYPDSTRYNRTKECIGLQRLKYAKRP